MNGPQLCFFCSLRNASIPRNLTAIASRNTRTYVSRASTLRHPAGAAAQRKDEEEEEEDEVIYAQSRTAPIRSQNAIPRRDSQQKGSASFLDDLINNNAAPQRNQSWRSQWRDGSFRNEPFDRPPNRQTSTRGAGSRFGASNDRNSEADGTLRVRRIPVQNGLLADAPMVRSSRDNNDRFASSWFDATTSAPSRQQAPPTRQQSLPPRQQDTSSRQDEPTRWQPRWQNRPSPEVRPSGYDAFSAAVRATGRDQDRPGPRTAGRYDDRGQPSRFRSNQRTEPGRSNMQGLPTDVSDETLVYEHETAETVEETEETKRRASRSERYAIDDEESEVSEATLKAQRAKDRAKDREFDDIEAQLDEDGGRRRKRKNKRPPKQVQQPAQRRLEIPEFISVQNMSQALGQRLEAFLEKLEEEGFEGARHDHLLDSGTAAMLAEVYGFEPVLATAEAHQDLVARPPVDDTTTLPPRPPIVTIMGHVDHGKTTILDYLRKANVVASEHGGITQHIGAFSVTMPGTQRNITFLDTPGHAAFLDMRRRGANVTDIVVLVVAADDSVKPQTIEAIKHSLEANVQIIVAINKVDKADADAERVKQDLARHDIAVEDYGGEYQAIALSGKTGQGMDDLEEAIITLADVSDYRAETAGAAEGWIIESKVTTAGRVATVLVRRGTLRPGDCIVAGNTWARVRTLRNDNGDLVSEALPGTPVQIDGWRGEDPTAGLEVLQADNEQHAKDVVDLRLEKAESLRTATDMAAINAARSDAAEARAKVLAWQAEQGFAAGKQSRIRLRDSRSGWLDTVTETGPRKIHFVVKADVAGSVEAIVAAMSSIGNSHIQANVIHSGTGMLTESDIRMLATSGEVSYAITFNQPVDGTIYRLAEAAGLEVLDHNVIYKVTDAVKEKLTAELPPLITTKVLGEAEIGKIFEITVKGKKTKLKIAGCRVTNGTISRASKVRVLRDGETVHTGSLTSLKNVKKDVNEMRKGTECGLAFEEWEEMQEGDHVQCLEELSEPRKLY